MGAVVGVDSAEVRCTARPGCCWSFEVCREQAGDDTAELTVKLLSRPRCNVALTEDAASIPDHGDPVHGDPSRLILSPQEDICSCAPCGNLMDSPFNGRSCEGLSHINQEESRHMPKSC